MIYFTIFLSNIANGLSPKSVLKKDDSWLIQKFKTTTNIDDKIIILDEMQSRQHTEFIPVYLACINSKEISLKIEAIEGAMSFNAYLSESRLDEIYLLGLTDHSNRVATLAAKGIERRLNSEEGTEYLVKSLEKYSQKSTSWQTRVYAYGFMKDFDNEKYDQTFIQCAESDSIPNVRITCLDALSDRKVGGISEMLYSISKKDESELVRNKASSILESIDEFVYSKTVAIQKFSAVGISDETQNGFENYLTSRLAESKVAKIVERTQLKQLEAEIAFQDELNDGTVIDASNVSRAEEIITGSITVSGNELLIIIKRIDIETNDVISSSQSTGTKLDILAVQKEVVDKFISSF
jgi:hypothetical protein